MFRKWVLIHLKFVIRITKFCNINLNVTLANKVLHVILELHTLACIMTVDTMVVTIFIFIILLRFRLIGIKKACYRKDNNANLD